MALRKEEEENVKWAEQFEVQFKFELDLVIRSSSRGLIGPQIKKGCGPHASKGWKGACEAGGLLFWRK